MTEIAQFLRGLPAFDVVLILGMVVAGDDVVFLGFIFPAEFAAVFAGVLVHDHRLHLSVILPIIIVLALLGDAGGFAIGRWLRAAFERRALYGRAATWPARAARRVPILVPTVRRAWLLTRAVVPMAAGYATEEFRTFRPSNIVLTAGWFSALLTFGAVLGRDAGHAINAASTPGFVLGVAITLVYLAISLYLSHRALQRGARSDSAHSAAVRSADRPATSPSRDS